MTAVSAAAARLTSRAATPSAERHRLRECDKSYRLVSARLTAVIQNLSHLEAYPAYGNFCACPGPRCRLSPASTATQTTPARETAAGRVWMIPPEHRRCCRTGPSVPRAGSGAFGFTDPVLRGDRVGAREQAVNAHPLQRLFRQGSRRSSGSGSAAGRPSIPPRCPPNRPAPASR